MKRLTLFLLIWNIIQQPRHTVVNAFANYLLSRSNCLIELDIDEVIMNNRVVAAEVSDDLEMKLHVNGKIMADGIHRVEQFPTTLTMSLQTTTALSDYQFAMDVVDGDATFPKGGCENNVRISGRNRDTLELVVNGPAVLIAGWATGQEGVRLVPKLSVTASSDVAAENTNTEKQNDLVSEVEEMVTGEGLEQIDPQKVLDHQQGLQQKLQKQAKEAAHIQKKYQQLHDRVTLEHSHTKTQSRAKKHSHHRSRLEKADSKNSLNPSVTGSSLVFGVLIMIGGAVVVIQVLLVVSKAAKGRRDL